MKYDFTSILDRRGMDALAVDPRPDSPYRSGFTLREGFDHIPMWIADMNFPACPTIPETMIRRLEHPAYGYFDPREEYFSSIIAWHEKRNAVKGLEAKHIGYENGVLGGVATALKICCSMGDSVLLHSPTYIGFTHVLENNGYHAVHSPLYQDEKGIWRMDYENMDSLIREHHIHAAIFCSPHNPTGRVWEEEEIRQAMEVFRRNDVTVISDEIWSDIILEGHRHIPTQNVSEDARNRTIALYAPSKTFNMAGLIGSYHIIYNKRLKERMDKEASLGHYNTMNLMSMYGLIGAYKPEGYEWCDELCQVLTGNVDYACDFIASHFKGVELARPQGTYLLYLDAEKWLKARGMDTGELLKKGYEVGVDWQDGRPFLKEHTIRVNLALPLSRVKEAFDRLDRYVFR